MEFHENIAAKFHEMLFYEIARNYCTKFHEMLFYEISRNILTNFREIIGTKFCEISLNKF
jgi:hypothetical protein